MLVIGMLALVAAVVIVLMSSQNTRPVSTDHLDKTATPPPAPEPAAPPGATAEPSASAAPAPSASSSQAPRQRSAPAPVRPVPVEPVLPVNPSKKEYDPTTL